MFNGKKCPYYLGFDLLKYLPQPIVEEYSSPQERKELVHYFCHQGYFIRCDNHQGLFVVRGSMPNHLRVLSLGLWQSLCFSKPVQFIVGKIKLFVE